MSEAAEQRAAAHLLELYDDALPEVYGYLLHRCGDVPTAQDLTSETFVAAARTIQSGHGGPVSIAWLIGVARHKLIDHWRRRAREERMLAAIDNPLDNPDQQAGADQWDAQIDGMRSMEVLRELGEHHRLALTLRYVDDLPVARVAELLGRTEHATEALLVRARAAFRRRYESGGDDAV